MPYLKQAATSPDDSIGILKYFSYKMFFMPVVVSSGP